jgi:hypothetical protein
MKDGRNLRSFIKFDPLEYLFEVEAASKSLIGDHNLEVFITDNVILEPIKYSLKISVYYEIPPDKEMVSTTEKAEEYEPLDFSGTNGKVII